MSPADPPVTAAEVWSHFEAEHGHEWADWARLTMAERWRENARLWDIFHALRGTPMEDASSIRTVLSAIRDARVRALLMGGQACILYGAAEFSRDADIAVVAGAENLARLADALRALDASVTAVPPFTADVPARGHAVHFRCAAADDTRLDVMAKMRNVAPFETCWRRRTTARLDGVGEIEVLGLADLVACKKTPPNKDWPMAQRLVDVHFARFAADATDERLHFWLRELRTPELLIDATRLAPDVAARVAAERPAVAAALAPALDPDARTAAIRRALSDEEARERADDEAYWRPLPVEQEEMRRALRRGELSLGWPPTREAAS